MPKLGIDKWLLRLVAASAGCIRNEVALRDPCVLTLCSGVTDALGTARAIDGKEDTEVEVENEKLEVVSEYCYLGDMLSAGGGCKLSVITRCKCARDKFRQLLPLLTNAICPF